MLDQDIKLNLESLHQLVISHNKQDDFNIKTEVLNRDNVIDHIKSWNSAKDASKQFLSIITLINKEGKKHALALQVEKNGKYFKLSIIDPLSCDNSEFTEEIDILQKQLSIFPGISYQTYTGSQNPDFATCGDENLFKLLEIYQEAILGNNTAIERGLLKILLMVMVI